LVEFSGLYVDVLPNVLNSLASKKFFKIRFVNVLTKDFFEERCDRDVFHTSVTHVCCSTLLFIICVVIQLEEYFFILHIEVSRDLEGTQFSKESQSLASKAYIIPVVVLFAKNIVELSL